MPGRLRGSLGGLARALVRAAPPRALPPLSNALLALRFRIEERRRQLRARRDRIVAPAIVARDGTRLERCVLEAEEPWRATEVPPCRIPGMLTAADKRYYVYLGKFYAGRGAAVEIGPWLGCSTAHILHGLLENPAFHGRRLDVYDDFVWRSAWMNAWLAGTGTAAPGNHDSFEPLFREHTAALAAHLRVTRARLSLAGGNAALPPMSWAGGPIELCFVDCGRSLERNLAWWEVLSPHFLADRTLVVMQDWQNHKAVPEVFWENTKLFTDRLADALDLIHEVRDSGTATFVFRGG
jgi:hypothetical protein